MAVVAAARALGAVGARITEHVRKLGPAVRSKVESALRQASGGRIKTTGDIAGYVALGTANLALVLNTIFSNGGGDQETVETLLPDDLVTAAHDPDIVKFKERLLAKFLSTVDTINQNSFIKGNAVDDANAINVMSLAYVMQRFGLRTDREAQEFWTQLRIFVGMNSDALNAALQTARLGQRVPLLAR